jgi:hypothetical protein
MTASKLLRMSMLVAALAVTGCVTVHESVPPKSSTGAAISTSTALPNPAMLPEQSAVAPGTKYVFIQADGGSIFLGPLVGSMNIAANTKAMAEKYKESVLVIDPTPIAFEAMAKAGIRNSADASYFAKPFVFVQHCYDERFRISLVFHVDGTGRAADWVGRYTYHLPTSYAVAGFGSLTREEVAAYRAELSQGAEILTSLMQRDLAGTLPATGKTVSFGSLYIMGNRLGGMGIYTMPEELVIPNVQLIEETDSYVTVRMRGNMNMTGPFGGMAFGVHRIDRKLVHTLRPPKAS